MSVVFYPQYFKPSVEISIEKNSIPTKLLKDLNKKGGNSCFSFFVSTCQRRVREGTRLCTL